jgi:hypothetical protein
MSMGRARERRWPKPDEILERAAAGQIDEVSLRVSLFDLDEHELLGKPPLSGPTRERKPGARKRRGTAA